MIHVSVLPDQAEARLCESSVLSEISSFNPGECIFFDIETAGLSADTGYVFLIGCICFDGGQWMLHQFLIQNKEEEKELLSSFFEMAGQYKALIHFNGNTFDIPFLQKRAAANHLESPLGSLASKDLYRRYRPLKKLLGFSKMNQKSLEAYVGWAREDELESGKMIPLFFYYSGTGDKETEQLLLKHNHDDLLGMLRVMKLEGYLSLIKGNIAPDLTAAETEDQNYLQIYFKIPDALCRPLQLFSDISSGRCSLSVNGQEGILIVPVFTGTLKYFFPDYKNYYYLPRENQAIHKSVAAFVDKEYRERAKSENCFTSKTGRFLALPGYKHKAADRFHIFRPEYNSKDYYFEYTKEFLTRSTELSAYVSSVIKFLAHACI